MIKKKLLRNIEERAIAKVNNYTSTLPVQIINNDISLQSAFIDKVNNSISKNEDWLNQNDKGAISGISFLNGDKQAILDTNQKALLSLIQNNSEVCIFGNGELSFLNGDNFYPLAYDRDITDNIILDTHIPNKKYIDNKVNQLKNIINTNKQNIKTNTSDIANLKLQDNQLENNIQTNTTNIITNTSDISAIKTKQTTQDSQIQANRDLSNQIIDGLKTLRVFNYIGTWNQTTTYKRNECVDYNNRLFLSKVDNNTNNTPPNDNQSNTYWLLIDSIQASIDLSGYYTKIEIDNKLQDYLTIATYNNNMKQLETRLANIETNKLNINDFNNFKNEINNEQQAQYNLINQKANTSDLANYVQLTNWSQNIKLNQVFFKNENINISGYSNNELVFKAPDKMTWLCGNNGQSRMSLTNDSLDLYQRKIVSIATPTNDNDAANKKYVDSQVSNVDSKVSNIEGLVKLNLTTQPRNIDITSFTNTGKTLDGHQIYEGLVFNGSNEANLVNGCTILLGAYLYNMTDNRFVSPESVNLRVQNNYQIRASLPSQEKQYRLYFVGVRN